MSILNLDSTLAPASIALIGASPREGSVGRVVLQNVRAGGFSGPVYPVNPKHDEVLGLKCYGKIADLPEPPDIAVIMTPAPAVPDIVRDLGARGTRVAVVLSAGATVANGLRQSMLEAARPSGLRVIGPNTIGLLSPRVGLNASFTHLAPAMGSLGLISQSGAIVSSIVDWAAAESIGFSQIFSLGDMADVDVGDCINLLAADDRTSAILMYLESVPAPRKFMSAARAAARIKPVIAVKPGRHAEAARAAATHTGALAGADRVIDAALRRAGVIRVGDLADLFDAAEVTGRYRPMQSARLGIVTNGGGAGVLAVDQLIDDGAALATLAAGTLATLDAALPATWSRANPVDIIGDAPPERYRAAIRAVAADPNVDALLVMNCPTALADPSAAAAAVAAEVRNGTIAGKPLLACWLGRKAAGPAREILQAAGIGNFESPSEAARAVALLTRWSTLRDQLQRVPPDHGDPLFDREAARAVLSSVASERRTLLTEDEAKALLAAYGVPTPHTIVAPDDAAVEAAARDELKSASAVVVKIRSKSVSHKSDVGGVALDLKTPEEARAAAAGMVRKLAAAAPGAKLDGFTVQPMIRRAGEELIVGLSTDPQFGPVVLFGAGGTAVEVVGDTATGLVPLDDVLAADLIDRTRVSKLLAGYRDRPPANRQAILDVLAAVSQIAIDFPMVVGIDINPLLADSDGVMALDARVEIDPARAALLPPNPALVIRPYPSAETKIVPFEGGDVLVRPIKPSDAALYPDFLAHITPEDMRLRFLVPTRSLSHATLIQLTQLDYDRDIAFVALRQPAGDLAAIARYASDPDGIRAEFGVLVRSDLKGRGMGRMIMQTLVEYARRQGLEELFGRVLRDNAMMLSLCEELGFTQEIDLEPNLVNVRLRLS
ncbi:MAG TPA: bifunctional acetate--CoA ligase family protein/GNAT family N-acetyltransferase [Devosia sp.]|nr:bifunctional acetate--CoA ligase family protein/GNAT family N-acetyltransferase [Devosia sp.]